MKFIILLTLSIFYSSCTNLPLREDEKAVFREEFTTTNKRLAGKLWRSGKYKGNLSLLTADDYLKSVKNELLEAEDVLRLVLEEGTPEIAIKGIKRDFYICLKSEKFDIFSCDQAIPYGVEDSIIDQTESPSEVLLKFIEKN